MDGYGLNKPSTANAIFKATAEGLERERELERKVQAEKSEWEQLR